MADPDYWEDAILHISKRDDVLSKIIEQNLEPRLNPHGDVFRTLIKSIVGQQISIQAADATWDRMVGLLGEINPNEICKAGLMDLRGCGLSMRKAEYISGVSEMWIDGRLDIDWGGLEQIEIRDRLLSIRGVGPWTVDMVLIFSLGFTDVLPTGDVGLLRAVENNYAGGRRLSAEEVMAIAECK